MRLPTLEQMFQGWFDNGVDCSPERAARLVAYLASGKTDVLSGRHLSVHIDAQQMLTSASEILERDLYVLREQKVTCNNCAMAGAAAPGSLPTAGGALNPRRCLLCKSHSETIDSRAAVAAVDARMQTVIERDVSITLNGADWRLGKVGQGSGSGGTDFSPSRFDLSLVLGVADDPRTWRSAARSCSRCFSRS